MSDEIIKPPAKLKPSERKVWNYLTEALSEVGRLNRTDSLMLMVICRTFCDWLMMCDEVEAHKLKHEGSVMESTPNGYRQPCQAFFAASRLKKELLQWLPEAALTTVSNARVNNISRDGQQGVLFDDPYEQYIAERPGAAADTGNFH